MSGSEIFSFKQKLNTRKEEIDFGNKPPPKNLHFDPLPEKIG